MRAKGWFCLILLGLPIACTPGEHTASSRGIPHWTHYQINTTVFAMAFEKETLWVGTGNGLLKYDLRRDWVIERYDSESGLPSSSSTITTIKIDPQGVVWMGTHGGGLVRADGKKWKVYTPPDVADPYIYDIAFDKDGLMWVATWSGVSVFDGKVWRSYTIADGLIDIWVYAVRIDQDGVKWFGTEGGVTRFNGKDWRSYTHKDGLGATEKEVGAYERIPIVTPYHTEDKSIEGYSPNFVLAIAVDGNNHKWFGTWGAGLSRFDGKTWKNYTMRDGLAGNFISDILVDQDGRLWIATEGGISVFDGTRWQSFTKLDGLLEEEIFTIEVDQAGRKWFGANGAISRLDRFIDILDQ